MTKHIALLLSAALLAFGAGGCGGSCSTYCDYVIECGLQRGCHWDDDAEALDECQQECDEALDDLSDRELEDAEACLDCLDEELGGECRDDDDLNDAYRDCDRDCDDDGAREFFSDWYRHFNPRIDC